MYYINAAPLKATLVIILFTIMSCGAQEKEEVIASKTHNQSANELTVAKTNKKLRKSQNMKANQKPYPENLAEGHEAIRKILGDDIGQMQFDSDKAKAFRQYLSNASFYTSKNEFSGGVTGTGSANSSTNVLFYQNGTFLHITTSWISISVPGMGSFDKDEQKIPGYWEVASLPDGTLLVIFYSQHPEVLQEFPNGFMPFPIKGYDQQYLISADNERYEKSMINNY
ncbi:hypothetical protein [Spongiivirga citrea]|uniref:Uncharacterized protein n=1 Tax=Spongiivirga citrea TaxID=1481457 RepID=A0A6M0CQG2_9FLAO|nr:hypothetical protein [Spongiivirga citrea]NER17747.1 hypothetical protein [Spongiivirga citrea]